MNSFHHYLIEYLVYIFKTLIAQIYYTLHTFIVYTKTEKSKHILEYLFTNVEKNELAFSGQRSAISFCPAIPLGGINILQHKAFHVIVLPGLNEPVQKCWQDENRGKET